MIYGPYDAVVASIHDGDTLTLALDIGFGITLTYPCRVFGINAPELRTTAGKQALDYVRTLVHPGDRVIVNSHGWDKYAPRFDGSIILPDGHDLAETMLAAGHAVPMK